MLTCFQTSFSSDRSNRSERNGRRGKRLCVALRQFRSRWLICVFGFRCRAIEKRDRSVLWLGRGVRGASVPPELQIAMLSPSCGKCFSYPSHRNPPERHAEAEATQPRGTRCTMQIGAETQALHCVTEPQLSARALAPGRWRMQGRVPRLQVQVQACNCRGHNHPLQM